MVPGVSAVNSALLAVQFTDAGQVTTPAALIIGALLVGITLGAMRYPSMAALIGWSLTLLSLTMGILTEMSLRPFYLVVTITGVAVLTGAVVYGK